MGTRPATCPQVLFETLDSQPQNDPSSDETDIGEQEDGCNNTADDSTLDNLDSSEASGNGTPTVIRKMFTELEEKRMKFEEQQRRIESSSLK